MLLLDFSLFLLIECVCGRFEYICALIIAYNESFLSHSGSILLSSLNEQFEHHFTWIYVYLLGFFVGFRGFRWIFMDLRDLSRFSWIYELYVGFRGFTWIFMDLRDLCTFSWIYKRRIYEIYVGFREFSWICEFMWICVDLYADLRRFHGFAGFKWIFIDLCGLTT